MSVGPFQVIFERRKSLFWSMFVLLLTTRSITSLGLIPSDLKSYQIKAGKLLLGPESGPMCHPLLMGCWRKKALLGTHVLWVLLAPATPPLNCTSLMRRAEKRSVAFVVRIRG